MRKHWQIDKDNFKLQKLIGLTTTTSKNPWSFLAFPTIVGVLFD